MQFEYTEPQTEIERMFGGHHCINAFGGVQPGDDVKFKHFLEKCGVPPRTTVYIDSTGGDVEAAMGIGRLIRGAWLETSIGSYVLDHEQGADFIVPRSLKPGNCLSAATLVFLGGKLRHWAEGARFGVHRFSYCDPLPENAEKSQVVSAKIATYLAEMCIDHKFLEDSAAVPSSEIELIDETRLTELGVLTGGMTDVTWTTQSRNNMLYVRGERDTIFGHQKVMLGYAKPMGFLFWAVIESQGRESELTGYPLVEIVVNEEDTRIDISDRCHRAILNAYTNVMCPISLEEAEVIATSGSFGVQIRSSPEAELFLGISAMDTTDGHSQLTTLFNTLRG